MLGFSGFHSAIGLTPSGNNSDIVDAYKKLSEKKDNFVAVTLANDKNTTERASATTIGAYGGLLQTGVVLGIHYGNKLRGKNQFKNPFLRFCFNSVDSYINFMQKHNIGKTPTMHKVLGIGTYVAKSMVLGAILGAAFDWYNTARNTIINNRILSTTSGEEGSWIASGLKSLSGTKEGQNIINQTIHKNDDESVTIRFKGINKEYNITKQELKDASRAYITYTNEDGKVSSFKKKFSKGDGDTLAVEVAFEKYCKEVANGETPQNPKLAIPNMHISESGDILYTNGSVNKLYYLLTGKDSCNFDISQNDSGDSISKLSSEIGIKHFAEKLAENPNKYIGEFSFIPTKAGHVNIRDKYLRLLPLSTDKNYTIISADKKYVTIACADENKHKYTIPISKLNDKIESVRYIESDKLK